MKKIKLIIAIIIATLLLISGGFLIYLNTKYLSKKEIKTRIINYMEVTNDKVYFEDIDLELEKDWYDVSLYYNNREYDFKVDATTGNIIVTNYYKNNTVNEEITTNNTYDNDEALNIILKEENLSLNDIQLTRKIQKIDDNKLIYEINFIYNNKKYDYEVDATTGAIIKKEVENNEYITNPTAEITEDEAWNIVLTDAKLKKSDIKTIQSILKYDDHILVYEIKFYYQDFEYEYKISAQTGSIIDFERDYIYS